MEPQSQSNTVVHLVVCALTLIAMVALVGMIWLLSTAHSAAEVGLVAAPMNTALGALGAMLVSTRTTTNRGAEPVRPVVVPPVVEPPQMPPAPRP